MRKIGIHHNTQPRAAKLAAELRTQIERTVPEVWLRAAEDATEEELRGTDLIVCVGGDGSMLRIARAAAPHGIPVLGVNMGRLGFLTELTPHEATGRIDEIIAGAGRVEERTMLVARIEAAGVTGKPLSAMNDIVVGRESIGRPVYVETSVDGAPFITYLADAVIVSSATGSTAYNLSAGGPVLHPEARSFLVTPVAPHLSLSKSLVVPPDAEVMLRLDAEGTAALSVDGQQDIILPDGAVVRVRRGPHVARFLRLHPPQHFYTVIGRHLTAAPTPAPKGQSTEPNRAP